MGRLRPDPGRRQRRWTRQLAPLGDYGGARVYNRVVDIGAFEFGSALPGDLNYDGAVNFADLLALAQHYGSTNATWEQGDLDGDDSVSFADLLTLSQNYGRQTTVTLIAAAAAPLDLILRRKAMAHPRVVLR